MGKAWQPEVLLEGLVNHDWPRLVNRFAAGRSGSVDGVKCPAS